MQVYSSWIIPQKNNLVLKIYDLDDGETDDDDRDRLGFSCPFCQELFDETDLAKEHVIKHHSDEENGMTRTKIYIPALFVPLILTTLSMQDLTNAIK